MEFGYVLLFMKTRDAAELLLTPAAAAVDLGWRQMRIILYRRNYDYDADTYFSFV